MVTSWVLAGGVAGGGVLIGVLALAGFGNAGMYLLLAPVLFIIGTVLGLVHGFVLALVGRPEACHRRRAIWLGLLGALTAAPLLGVSWLIAAGISLTTALLTEWRWSWFVVTSAGWLLGAAVCMWAAVEGARALNGVYQRCPRRRLGAKVLIALFVASCALSWQFFPTQAELTLEAQRLGSLALAAAGTLWIWMPAVYLALQVAGRLEGDAQPVEGGV